MMKLVHSYSPLEEVSVLFDDGIPFAVYVQRPDEIPVGSVCLGRAVKENKGAWFVDIGLGEGHNAFVSVPETYCRPDGTVTDTPLSEGDTLLLQVQRPAFEEKEMKLSAQVSLASALIVYMPMRTGISFSRYLTQDMRLRMLSFLPEDAGSFLVRTEAANVAEKAILKDIGALAAQWKELCRDAVEKAGRKEWGVVLRAPQTVIALAEKYQAGLEEIVTDHAPTAAVLKKTYPVAIFSNECVWDKEGVGEAVDEALQKKTSLPSGGSLITEQTAACVCFDVNSGSGRLEDANQEACPEILRQIVLKGLSGQMVVDFAGKKETGRLRRFADKLKNPEIFVCGVSPMGLVEMTTERSRRSVFELFSDAYRNCAAELVRRLWFARAAGNITVTAPVNVSVYIRPYLSRLEERLGTGIELKQGNTVEIEGIKQ